MLRKYVLAEYKSLAIPDRLHPLPHQFISLSLVHEEKKKKEKKRARYMLILIMSFTKSAVMANRESFSLTITDKPHQ